MLYYTTLEPFDRETLAQHYNNGKILIVEPEFEGSLSHDVIKSFNGKPVQIEEVAFPREIFRNYGTYEEKMEYYGLTTDKIQEKLIRLV